MFRTSADTLLPDAHRRRWQREGVSIVLGCVLSGGTCAAPWTDLSVSIPQATLSDRTMDVVFGDANGDGHPDLFIAREFAPNLLLLNDGAFGFGVAAGAIPARGEDSEDIALADFDGDGDLDVIFVSEDTPQIEYYRNDGSGRFSASACSLPANIASNAIVAGDLDGDGDTDLVIASNRLSERVFLNDGNGCFADVSAAWMPNIIDITQDLQLIDVDGDGDLDLIAGNEPTAGGRNRLYINHGTRFVDETSTRLPAATRREETRKIAVGDVNGDGHADFVFGNVDFQNPSAAANRLMINDGSGRFSDQSASRLPADHRATLEAVLYDIDDDGDLDLVLGNFPSGLQVLRNEGDNFVEATQSELGAAASPRNVIGLALVEAAGKRYLYEAGFNVPDRLLAKSIETPGLRPSHSGVFYPPDQSGHGIVMVISDTVATLSWFTYDSDGRSVLVTAAGDRPNGAVRTLSMPAWIAKGMRFGEFDPATLVREPWGTLSWTMIDCDRGQLEYASEYPKINGEPFGSGRISMVRLLSVGGLQCP